MANNYETTTINTNYSSIPISTQVNIPANYQIASDPVINDALYSVNIPKSKVGEGLAKSQTEISKILAQGNKNTDNIASAARQGTVQAQGIGDNANPEQPKQIQVQVKSTTGANAVDWRVNISVPSIFPTVGALEPLSKTNNRMIFPFNPSITISHTAQYSPITLTHTNYAFNSYENSVVDNYVISGEFYSENDDDAKYWLASVHFLRSATKMFYGNSALVGMPPVVCRLNGYGKHVLNNIPVIITNFTADLNPDVDYIECKLDGETNYVPVKSTISVTCVPNYARRTHAKFGLEKFAKGEFVGSSEGFV